jgi:L,D-transpeptidase catalytic domain
MKKIIYILCSLLLLTQLQAWALPNNEELEARTKTEQYIKYVYEKLSFKKMQKLSFEAFSKGYYGYLNLKESGKINNAALLTICDFSLSSNLKRLWVIDVNKKKVMYNTLVAHGMGTGEEYATKFSNIENSHQSSLGFYTTGETYIGDNGFSLKLHGQDGAFNNNAFDRAIVMHGADYVSNNFAANNNRLGRSHGCPALPREVNDEVINKIKNGQVLFVYHPTKAYLKTSYWLNNRISHLPDEANFLEILQPKTTNPRWVQLGSANDSMALVKRIIPLASKPIVADSVKFINTVNTQMPKQSALKPVIPKQTVDKDFLYIR